MSEMCCWRPRCGHGGTVCQWGQSESFQVTRSVCREASDRTEAPREGLKAHVRHTRLQRPLRVWRRDNLGWEGRPSSTSEAQVIIKMRDLTTHNVAFLFTSRCCVANRCA